MASEIVDPAAESDVNRAAAISAYIPVQIILQ